MITQILSVEQYETILQALKIADELTKTECPEVADTKYGVVHDEINIYE